MQTILSLSPMRLLSSPTSTDSVTSNNATASKPLSRRHLELLDDSDDQPWNRSLSQLNTHPIPSATGPFSTNSSSSSSKTRQKYQHIQLPSTPISRKERRPTSQGSAVRSILRGPNTPGTGQSVRFFSKDAYKVISPNLSPSATRSTNSRSSPSNSPQFTRQMQELTVNNSHSNSLSSLPNISDANLFDISLDMPPIPLPEEGGHMLSDDAIEVEEESREKRNESSPSTGSLRLKLNDSPTQFHTAASLPSPPSSSPIDIVNTDATSYWSTRSWLPSLRRPVSPTTLLSAQTDLIASLREELAVQKSITAQYEADLYSRDALVDILSERVERAEEEVALWAEEEEEQWALVKGFRRQLESLERAYRRLKIEAGERGDISREEEINRVVEERDELRNERDELHEEVARLQRAQNDLQETRDDKETEVPQMRMLQEELEAQWERTEKASEELKVLRTENTELQATITALQQQRNGSGSEPDSHFDAELEQTNLELVNQLNDVVSIQQALEDERDALIEERDQLSAELRSSRQHVDDLMQSHSDLQRRLEGIEQEHAFTSETADRLHSAMDARDREIKALEDERQECFAELEDLRARLCSAEKEHARQLSDRARHITELENMVQTFQDRTERATQMMNESTEREVYLAAVEEKAEGRREENERLRRRMHELELESAAKEVKLVEVSRDRERVMEDNMNLNIALDSKQQELELIKRKLGVKGTGGATPAPSRTFGTTPAPSRLLTGLNKTLTTETPGTEMKTPRAKQLSSSTNVKGRNGNEVKMGPPTITRPPRQSMGSPTPFGFARPTSADSVRESYEVGNVRTTSGTTRTHSRPQSRSLRRASASSLNMDNEFDFDFGVRDEDEEKENQAPIPPTALRRSHMMMMAPS